MDIIADDINDKEELKKAPPVVSLQVVKQIPDKETKEIISQYKIIQDGDLVKQHNTKSHYLNDMTGFEND